MDTTKRADGTLILLTEHKGQATVGISPVGINGKKRSMYPPKMKRIKS